VREQAKKEKKIGEGGEYSWGERKPLHCKPRKRKDLQTVSPEMGSTAGAEQRQGILVF